MSRSFRTEKVIERGEIVKINIELPCDIGDIVYTVDEIVYPCQVCEKMGRINTYECYCKSTTYPFTGAAYECPNAYEISEHTCEGFEVSKNNDGITESGHAGEWGYEGLECFVGRDGRQYYTKEDAEMALNELITSNI